MKRVRLNKMRLLNFKGVENKEYSFTENTQILGANGTGKSTIFDAYLWCLFDKNQNGEKPKVQPLDGNNQIIPNVTTEVEIALVIDGGEMKVARRMTGKKDGGTESKYFVNDVPMTQSQFKAKMGDIADMDHWFNISSINIIPAMEQKVCRAALQEIAPAFDEKQIAVKYDKVLEAMQKGLTIDELAQRTKADRVKAKQELDSIPARMEAQDRLRVDADFKALEDQLAKININGKKVEAEIEELQKVHVDSKSVAKEEERRKRMADLSEKINQISKETSQKQMAIETDFRKQTEEYESTIRSAEADIKSYDSRLESLNQQIESTRAEVDALREVWKETNAEEYVEPEIRTTCPTCGQMLPEDRINETKEKARSMWNAAKVEKLKTINEKGKIRKAELERLQGDVDDIKENAEKRRVMIEEAKAELESLRATYNIPDVGAMLAENAAYQEAKALYDALLAEMKSEAAENKGNEDAITAKVQPLKEKLVAIRSEQTYLLRRLSAKEANDRIDEERKRLEAQQAELAQAIAEYENIESQIAAFRKEKIEAVENGVSSLFSMVHWKMYEANVTNDGEKEICTPIIDGIPFGQQNTATQYNAALDIVNGFAKAYGLSIPLFIDGAESVSRLIPTHNQLITLAVSDDDSLNIK